MPRKKAVTAPDPMESVKVEVGASLGDSYIKAECTLAIAHAVLVRLHQELELAATIKPDLKPVIDTLMGGSTWVPDDDGYGEYRKRSTPKLGF